MRAPRECPDPIGRWLAAVEPIDQPLGTTSTVTRTLSRRRERWGGCLGSQNETLRENRGAQQPRGDGDPTAPRRQHRHSHDWSRRAQPSTDYLSPSAISPFRLVICPQLSLHFVDRPAQISRIVHISNSAPHVWHSTFSTGIIASDATVALRAGAIDMMTIRRLSIGSGYKCHAKGQCWVPTHPAILGFVSLGPTNPLQFIVAFLDHWFSSYFSRSFGDWTRICRQLPLASMQLSRSFRSRFLTLNQKVPIVIVFGEVDCLEISHRGDIRDTEFV